MKRLRAEALHAIILNSRPSSVSSPKRRLSCLTGLGATGKPAELHLDKLERLKAAAGGVKSYVLDILDGLEFNMIA